MKDNIPVKWIEIDTKALTTDVETNEISNEIATTKAECVKVVEQLPKIGLYDDYIQKSKLENQRNGLFSLTIFPKIYAISFLNPDDKVKNVRTKQHQNRFKKLEKLFQTFEPLSY